MGDRVIEIEDRLYTLAEVEGLTTVTRRTLYNWIDSGYLQAVKVGGRWKVPAEEIENVTSGTIRRYGSRVYAAGKPTGYTLEARARKAAERDSNV